ncbi:MAG: anaerobic carbon-monoxide dehydrogenase catalytic subunit [Archaeoglobaceae archaeon]|nr:anaerobic carbon-monoxide dehydrogenase catalytic subunit [Archaeoglobaceae archaeon]
MENKSFDPAALEMLEIVKKEGYETAWERLEKQQPQCGFGLLGVCCRNCMMGPCRINPFGDDPQRGVCGATADVIVARNVDRMIAGGASAHSDHGRRPAILLKEVAEGKNRDYQIKDVDKLKAVAQKLGIDVNAEINEIALKVAEIALNDFGKQDEEPIKFLMAYAPKKRIELWKKVEEALSTNAKIKILPRNIDREIVDIMHRTHIGVDNEALSLLAQGIRAALADGWGGSLIATEFQDILFGTPMVKEVEANLGVIDPDYVNIIVHGHEPVLSEKIVEVAESEEMQNKARQAGAKGINLIGMCCTGNEILMRQGVPIAGNVLHSELSIVTGAIDAMVVDVQCIFPALPELADCFHTVFISTSEQAKFEKGIHIQFEEDKAIETAKKIIEKAIEAYSRRDKSKIYVPKQKSKAIVGFSVEQILKALGGSVKPIVDVIVEGKIKGVAGIVGCNNPKVKQDYFHVTLTKELISRDILVIGTGCWAIAAAKAGLMTMDAVKMAGDGLKSVCQALNIPPVLHMGSCVDCSRMLVLAGAIADYLNADISDLPLVGSAPEWYTEKAVSIGTYFIASGIPVHLWPLPPVLGSEKVTKILTEDVKELLGGYFFIEGDPIKTVEKMEEIIMEKRKKLGI